MQKIIDKINAAASVAVLAHVNEDADALGSSYAFAEVMRMLGKRAVCFLNEEDSHLGFLKPEYVVYNENEAHETYDLCVCLDCGDEQRLGSRTALFNGAKSTVNIDHHKTNTFFADENYVNPASSATGEILFELFRYAGWEIDRRTAQFLYAAICSDTGCFKYSNVTPKTMRVLAELLEYNFDHAETVRLLFDTYSMEVTKFKGYVMQNIKSISNGRISLVRIKDEWASDSGLNEDEIPNVVDIPRCVAGTEIAVVLRNTASGGVRFNLRSNGKADVAAVALKFGGGGHAKAAGGTIKNMTIDAAERSMIDSCKEALA